MAAGATDINTEPGPIHSPQQQSGPGHHLDAAGSKGNKSPLKNMEFVLCLPTTTQHEVCPGALLIYPLTLN